MEINAILTIAYRDFMKLLRDRMRIVLSLTFPVIFIGVLGGSLQANLADDIGYNFMLFMFTGVMAQTLFQSTASGVISLIEDRKNDFSQEIFVSPISRYSIIIGKIVGELSVALIQGIAIVIFAFIIRVPFNWLDLLQSVPAIIVSGLLGGSFGLLVLANLNSERNAREVFPFLMFPQFFLAGVFSPIKNLPPILDVLSKIVPMRYAVDLVRGMYYLGDPAYEKIVLFSPTVNILIIVVMFVIFTTAGTYLFVRNERNR